jgi:bifunctional polynucleotide phosphatase/kinase
MNPESRSLLPEIAFNTFGAKLQEPKLEEGFTSIFKIPFKFDGSDDEKKLWSKYWY